MTRIGVLSDTHLQGFRNGAGILEGIADRWFDKVEIVLHAGDLVDPDVLLGLGDRRVYCVRGNVDPPTAGVPQSRVLEIGGFRIGLIHGWGAPEKVADKVMREFEGSNLHCLVFGHTHRPVCERRNGLLLFNPGSPTEPRGTACHSVGLLTLDATVEGRIINLDAD